MPSDDERIYRAARAAAAGTREGLARARDQVARASSEFDGRGSFLDWNTLGEKVARHGPVAANYRGLKKAISEAEAAIRRAEKACEALQKAIPN